MLFGPEPLNRTAQTKPPFKPYDQVKIVHLDGSGWKQYHLVGKRGTVLDFDPIPNVDPKLPGNFWLRVNVGGETVSLLDAELELIPAGPSAIALGLCHR